MRHDEHYVEALAASAGAPIGRLVPIEKIDPNPNQPRQVMGDLSELMASVAEKGVIELALVENIQRKDLTPFEEAEALQHLAVRSAYTHEALARKLGKSRTSITESLALNAMPEEIKNLCRLADISSKSLLLQIVRQPTPQKMTALIEKIASQGGATRAEVRQDLAKTKPGRPKAYIFNYRPESKAFNLKLRFRKGNVPKQEVIEALEAIIEELRSN
jgi:ParB family chromosome partitioning protein